MDRFTDFFNTPKNGLTRDQKNKMYDTFGKMVRSIVDAKGNPVFRFNNRTKNVELADGEQLPDVKFSMRDTSVANATNFKDEINIQENIKKGIDAMDKVIRTRGNVLAAIHRKDIGDIDFLWGEAGNPDNNYRNGYGVAHIIARRNYQGLDGKAIAKLMPEIIMKGKKIQGLKENRVELHHGAYVAILDKNFIDGQEKKNHWLLTGFKRMQRGESVSERGEGSNSAAPTALAPTSRASQGRNGFSSTESVSQSENKSNELDVKFSGKNLDTRKNLDEKFFNKYLTQGSMKSVENTIAREIDEHVDLSKMSDPVERDKARESLPSIRKLKFYFNQIARGDFVEKDRCAVELEYARRCFDNDRRIQAETFRQIDGDYRQGRKYGNNTKTVSGYDTARSDKVRGQNAFGVLRNVSGEYGEGRKHFLKLYDEFLNDTKFSIDNGETLAQKIRNKFADFISGQNNTNERTRKRITQKLKQLTGYKIAYGHLLGKDDAIVDHVNKVIRAKNAYEWEKILPKVGEVMARQLNLTQSPKMHEYLANWLMDDAPDISSNEAKEFQRAMRDNPAVYEIMRGIQTEFQNFANMTPMERTSAKIVNQVPEKSTLSKIVDGRFYEEFVDDLNPIKKLVDTFEQESGLKLKTSINPYELARLYKGSAGMAQIMLEGNDTGKVRGALKKAFPAINFDEFKPLAVILDEVGGKKELDNFQSYCVACQSKELHEANHELEKKIAELQRKLNELQKNPPKNKSKIKKYEDEIKNLNGEFYETMMSEKDCDAIIRDYKGKFGNAQQDLVRLSRTSLAILTESGVGKNLLNALKVADLKQSALASRDTTINFAGYADCASVFCLIRTRIRKSFSSTTKNFSTNTKRRRKSRKSILSKLPISDKVRREVIIIGGF